MDKTAYFNDLLARSEELFYHELSDCAAWKTEFCGIDFIQSRNIRGKTPEDIIENCVREMVSAGLIHDAAYSIGGMNILLYMKVAGCIHVPKEAKLLRTGIKPYNCPIINMILDQLIEKLKFETTYVADLEVDVEGKSCEIKCAIFQTADQIGNVCDWSDECRLIDENQKWKTVTC